MISRKVNWEHLYGTTEPPVARWVQHVLSSNVGTPEDMAWQLDLDLSEVQSLGQAAGGNSIHGALRKQERCTIAAVLELNNDKTGAQGFRTPR
jgi:hypothetical protein